MPQPKVADNCGHARSATRSMEGHERQRTPAEGRKRTWMGTQRRHLQVQSRTGAENTGHPELNPTIMATADIERARATTGGCQTLTGCNGTRASAHKNRKWPRWLRTALYCPRRSRTVDAGPIRSQTVMEVKAGADAY